MLDDTSFAEALAQELDAGIGALPEAPMPMPPRVLEWRRRKWLGWLRFLNRRAH